jgi:hypothetical protein
MTQDDEQQKAPHLRMQITPHAGGEVPSRHIAVIAKIAATVVAHMHQQVSTAASPGGQRVPWARQARGLIDALHAAAHRLKQPRTIAS